MLEGSLKRVQCNLLQLSDLEKIGLSSKQVDIVMSANFLLIYTSMFIAFYSSLQEELQA